MVCVALSTSFDTDIKAPSLVSGAYDGIVDAVPLLWFGKLPGTLAIIFVASFRDRKCKNSFPASFTSQNPRGPLLFFQRSSPPIALGLLDPTRAFWNLVKLRVPPGTFSYTIMATITDKRSVVMSTSYLFRRRVNSNRKSDRIYGSPDVTNWGCVA